MKARGDKERLLELIAQGEHEQQDFKYVVMDAAKLAKSVSAFANTKGGRLLIGVRDDGMVHGVTSEEEIFMMHAAAERYCTPAPSMEFETLRVEGRTVVICTIPRSEKRPIYAVEDVKIDAQTGHTQHVGKRYAYIRIKDENIVASPVHLDIWKHEQQEQGSIVHYSDDDTRVVDTLEANAEGLSLNRVVRLSGVKRFKVIRILSRLVRYDLAQWKFEEREFRFEMKK
jgi:predicted HTH transcriptional regulator